MNVLGIISEYNPLHSGHVYHIEASRKKTAATHVVCVMSGHFVQRGEPALVDKWARTRMALLAGIDLVLELPVVFACASAEYFAYGGVRTLHNTGVVDCLSFGTERGEIESLLRIASVLHDEPEAYRKLLKKALKEGLSFAAAREKALAGCLCDLPENILSQSNNILAIEYLKALKSLNSSIRPVTVKREGSLYQDTELISSFSSATAIRTFFQKGGEIDDPLLTSNLPPFTLDILNECFSSGRGPVFSENFSSIILHSLRTMTAEKLKRLPDVNEGLENRLISAAMQSGTMKEFTGLAATSRYPYARIKRIATGLLWGISKKHLNGFVDDINCGYLRVLGFNTKGRELLQRMRKEARVPVIIKVSNYRNQLSGLSKEMFEYDIKATNSYVLGFPEPCRRIGDQDFTTPVVRIE